MGLFWTREPSHYYVVERTPTSERATFVGIGPESTAGIPPERIVECPSYRQTWFGGILDIFGLCPQPRSPLTKLLRELGE